jgi:thioredoxin 1
MVTEINNTNFEEFIKEGSVFLQVSTSWCGPCKIMSPIIESTSNDIDSVKFGKIDAEENREISQKLGVRSVPAFFVFKNGELINQSVGMKTKEQIFEMINN